MSSAPEQKKEQKMWGGRFERGPDASFYEFERSWQFDRRLLPQELALDRAWARAIAAAGILNDEECAQIVRALDEIESRAKAEPGWLDGSKADMSTISPKARLSRNWARSERNCTPVAVATRWSRPSSGCT